MSELTAAGTVQLRQEIGGRLRRERKRLGLTQAVLGQALGVSDVTILNYESGLRSPTAEQIHVLCQLGMRVGYVLSGRITSVVQDLPALFERAVRVVVRYAELCEVRLDDREIRALAWQLLDAMGGAESEPDEETISLLLKALVRQVKANVPTAT